jgi:hypothetical protein
MMIGCEAYASVFPPTGHIYHILNDDVLITNKLKTLCGETGLVSFWFTHFGDINTVTCKKCIDKYVKSIDA